MSDALVSRGWHEARATHAKSRDGSDGTVDAAPPTDFDNRDTLHAKAALSGDSSILHHRIRDCDQQAGGSATSCQQQHEDVTAQVWLSRSAQTGADATKLRRATIDTMSGEHVATSGNTSSSVVVVIAPPRSLQRTRP
jgi:Tfp pilus assembly protein PilV